MTLYLLRHGDALESGYDDTSRPLSLIGEEQAATVANFFTAMRYPVGTILSSPFVRARQMAEIIGMKLGKGKPESTEFLVPGTNEKQLFQQLNDLRSGSALLIGHEPHLRTTASLLLSGSRELFVEFRKATLACIDCPRGVEPEAGALKWIVRVEQMETMKPEVR
ncbi:MAG TPA: phosphohistidine phosphatase SixA [Bacteroidota bacterium]|jgi:phosphohistidine phosphatase|nr:phosphohistidine phosphatase SixA [Bacteroidota bacterium]